MRPSWVEIDLDAIRHNVGAFKSLVAPARYCAVVKADAYGHGDVPVAEAALQAGADSLAVALLEEGVRLREAGIEAPILVLSEPDTADAKDVVTWSLTPTVYRESFLSALEAVADDPLPVHVKADTGMHRVGADPSTAMQLARQVAASERLRLEGLWTHFPVADEDPSFTADQIHAFNRLVQALRADDIAVPILHMANTAGAIAHPESRKDMVRIGLGTYGLLPVPGMGVELGLRPAMRVVSRVSMVKRLPRGARPSYGRRRPMPASGTVATVPIGYADGIARRLSAVDGELLIRGHRYPFAGVVTMDHLMVDVGSAEVDVGDEVVILGRQGEEEITAEEWGRRLDTINYEILCRFGPRLPRRYVG